MARSRYSPPSRRSHQGVPNLMGEINVSESPLVGLDYCLGCSGAFMEIPEIRSRKMLIRSGAII
jgi:hypothetical protein